MKFKEKIDGEKTYSEIYYWRKVPCLQGWMENLYREKGGEEVFNCEYVRLDEQDLECLKKDVLNGNLPPTTGFFFGDHREDDMKYVLRFVSIAKRLLKAVTLFITQVGGKVVRVWNLTFR